MLFDDAFREFLEGKHCGRTGDDDGHRNVVVRKDCFEGCLEALGGSIADNVDRVVDVGLIRHLFAESGERLVAELRELQVRVADGVGRHHAGAAGVRDDGDFVPVRERLAGENLA